jgi:peptidoglycan/xylan/chitin deacetylase (PgdA/CDA1 family)
MSHATPRRIALTVSAIGVALLSMLGFVLWRTLPPLMPEEKHMAETTRPSKAYKPVSNLPTVLESPDLSNIRFALITNVENNRVHSAGYYDREVQLWRKWMLSAGAREVAIPDAEVLIAPAAECLGVAERNQITYKLAAGGGLVSTGVMGASGGQCEMSHDTLVTRLLGITPADVAPADIRRGESVHAIVLGETLLGARIPPGARIELEAEKQIAFHSKNREIFYTNYERVTRPVKGVAYFDGAATRAQVGKGRYVAFGFDFQNLADDWSKRLMADAMASAVRWAAGYPVVQIAPWPEGKKAAAVLAMDVEADFHNARNTVPVINGTHIPATAFVVGKLAEADPRTMQMLASYREIATHTYDHLPLDTFSIAGQMHELEKSKRVTEKLAGRGVPGMRPPEERFNFETLKIWADLGGDYVFGANNMRVAAPEIVPLDPDSLILLARVSEDDFELLERDKMRDASKISTVIIDQLNEVLALRGLYMFSYHSHMFAQKELVPILQQLAQKIAATPSIWAATAGEVATWWRNRSHLQLSPRADGSMRLLNAGQYPVENIVLRVYNLDGSVDRIPVNILQPGDSTIIDASRDGRFAPVSARSGK